MTARISSSRPSCGSSEAAGRRAFVRAVLLLIAAGIVAAGCATNGPPEVGSRGWHELRIAEIDAARERGELTTEQYLSLKNQADATRAAYRAALQAPRYNYYPSPFFFPHYHWH